MLPTIARISPVTGLSTITAALVALFAVKRCDLAARGLLRHVVDVQIDGRVDAEAARAIWLSGICRLVHQRGEFLLRVDGEVRRAQRRFRRVDSVNPCCSA